MVLIVRRYLAKNSLTVLEPLTFYCPTSQVALIDLRDNIISVIKNSAFASLDVIEDLRLSGNMLTTIEIGAFDLPSLKSL